MAAITYKCPNCGGGLVFEPETQKYHCEYCLSDFELDQLEGVKEGEPPQEKETLMYQCPSCGASIVADETTVASFCYYCHNPIMLTGRVQGEFKPDYVVPFRIDREKALEIFSQWMEKKRFVPEAFYSKKQIETMTGVYFPYWLYSCKAKGDIRAQGRKLRVWTTGNMRYTETNIYEVNRQGAMDVDNVARSALRKANRKLVDSVLPYNMKEKREFAMGYLSGFMAENRDMEQQEFSQEVKDEVRQFALGSIREQLGEYDHLDIGSSRIELQEEEWKLALLPVWTLTYRDRAGGKIYYFALNGQTGKVSGELPVDSKKLTALFLSIFLPMLIFFLIGGYILG